jgi:iron(III) transport system substrate-binding protein
MIRFFRWLILVFLAFTAGCTKQGERVVLYCAQDEEFADAILRDFHQQTGITVDPKFDTEADKSVSLYAELVQEQARPRCDVYWNNEILSTIRLARKGMLEPYASPEAASYPAATRAKDDTWHAFATRARVLIVNNALVMGQDRPTGLLELTEPRWKGRLAMAKPQFGTTATQAACLFEVLGPAEAKRFYSGLRENGIHIVPGNKQVAEGVGAGQFAVGMTDTDDAMAEVEAGHQVTIVFPDSQRPANDRMGTLFIPNTLAIIRGCPNGAGVRHLVDFLLSPHVEAELAQSASRQIPLNPLVMARPPAPIKRPEEVKTMNVDFERAADLWDEAQAFLRNEFARP